MAAADTDFHTRDLFESIAGGDHPSWTLKVQIMPYDDAVSYRFNPFDLTKVWPHGDYPLQEVGRMTLHTNPTDNHAQIEQVAFEPNNVVPGIGFSPDRMLLGRVFSYADAHRHRLGANYKQIPVNAPRNEVHTYSKDGAMRINPVTDRCMRRTPRAVRQRRSPGRPSRSGPPTATSSAAPTSIIPKTTTGVRRARWCARSSTTPPGIAWWTTSSVTCSTVSASPCWPGPRVLEPGRHRSGAKIKKGVTEKADEPDPKKAEQGNPARSSMQQKV